MLEQDIQRKIQDDLKRRGAWVVKTITTNRNGCPDILACLDGVFVAIEVKRPGLTATPLQRAQIDRINRAGGISFVAWDVSDLDRYL